MRTGKRYGVDVGKVRIGLAESDDEGILATPVETVHVGASDVRKIARIVRENNALEVIVGLPVTMKGLEDSSTKRARRWARRLGWAIKPIPVRLFDERLSTVSAHHQLDETGHSHSDRQDIIDQAAAVLILQTALDNERLTGRPPGELLEIIDREKHEENDE
ncbi:MAG: Holliday junction resolvase RuvX [Actinomycetaceae bacterium]|nr:Holliday junction resolvase RuvX [Actinomycetaceae bacterium]